MVEEYVDVEYLSLSMGASEYTFRHRSTCRTPGESEKEYPTSGKEYIEPCQTRQDQGTRGKNRSVSSTGPALSRWEN